MTAVCSVSSMNDDSVKLVCTSHDPLLPSCHNSQSDTVQDRYCSNLTSTSILGKLHRIVLPLTHKSNEIQSENTWRFRKISLLAQRIHPKLSQSRSNLQFDHVPVFEREEH